MSGRSFGRVIAVVADPVVADPVVADPVGVGVTLPPGVPGAGPRSP